MKKALKKKSPAISPPPSKRDSIIFAEYFIIYEGSDMLEEGLLGQPYADNTSCRGYYCNITMRTLALNISVGENLLHNGV
jgi:hypothetical protein